MSTKKTSDLHVHLTDTSHARLTVLATAQDRKINELAGLLLEKAIAGEFHAFGIAANRFVAAGLMGKVGE
jgi:hypothetical protein